MQTSTNKWLYQSTQEFKSGDKNVSKDIGLLKPGRKLREAGDIFYSSEVSKFAKAGVLPRAAWGTILSNSGGTISDQDRQAYGKLLIEFRDKSIRVQQLSLKNGILTGTEESELRSISQDLEAIRVSIQSFESDQVNIFENTAESKARNKAILWWVLNLSYEKTSDGSYKELVPGDTYEKKLEFYDKLEEEDSEGLVMNILSKMVYYTTLWFIGRASKQEDFDMYASQLEDAKIKDLPVPESKVEDTASTEGTNSESDDDVFIPQKISE